VIPFVSFSERAEGGCAQALVLMGMGMGMEGGDVIVKSRFRGGYIGDISKYRSIEDIGNNLCGVGYWSLNFLIS